MFLNVVIGAIVSVGILLIPVKIVGLKFALYSISLACLGVGTIIVGPDIL